jgi:hypothetical protein
MKQVALHRQLNQLALLENLVAVLSRQGDKKLREALGHERPEVRWAAAWVAGNRLKPLQEPLIELLTDPDGNVRQAARRALVLLANKDVIRRALHFNYPLPPGRITDFGPEPGDGEEERGLAATRWQFWWLDRQTASPGDQEVKARSQDR